MLANFKKLIMSSITVVSLTASGLFATTTPAQAAIVCPTYFSEGTGSSAAPFGVTTQAQFEAIGTCGAPGVYFKMKNDIVLNGAFVPPSNFYGIFDGGDYEFTGLNIIATDGVQGLFRSAFGDEATRGTVIKNLFVSGRINGGGNAYIAQLAGQVSNVTFDNVHTNVLITNAGDYSGNILGQEAGITMTNSSAFSQSCLAKGYKGYGIESRPLTVATQVQLEGLGVCSGAGTYFKQTAGINLNSSYVPPSFSGIYNGDNRSINNLALTSDDNYRGLFSVISGDLDLRDTEVANLNISGQILAGNHWQQGGLAGRVSGAVIDNVKSSVSISGSGGAYGSLVGDMHNAVVINSSATGNVTLTASDASNAPTGGLIGGAYENSSISKSFATGNVTPGGCLSGGLIGDLEQSQLATSYATGSVSTTCSTTYSSAGGLVGYAYNAKINLSYATGNVSSAERTGGLVGGFEENFLVNGTPAIISDSYATGSSTGTLKVGSLVGSLCGGTVTRNYATGAISSTQAHSGGAIGGHEDTVWEADCPNYVEAVSQTFWDQTLGAATNLTTYVGEVAKTTAELKNPVTYSTEAGWSISNSWTADSVWTFCPFLNSDYPVLVALTTEAACAAPTLARALPTLLTAPTVSGSSKKVGKTLGLKAATWTSTVTPTLKYQWYRCSKAKATASATLSKSLKCSAIASATKSTYKLTKSDKAKYILARVTATNPNGSTKVYTKASSKIS